jgi:excisionase family DNA binding protein
MVVIVYNEARMYSVREAATKLGISDSHCRRLVESGVIKGKKLGHDWLVLSLDYKRKRKPKRKEIKQCQ